MPQSVFNHLLDLESELMALRGFVSALLIINDYVGPEIVNHRETLNALHSVMSATLRKAEQQVDFICTNYREKVIS